MLRHIPDILSPEMLKVMQQMGHGDTICISDGNFPCETIAKASGAVVIDLSGHGVCEILDAYLRFTPIDDFVANPVRLMQAPPESPAPIQKKYVEIISKYDERGGSVVEAMERYAFYDEAKKCCAIVKTGETGIWANIILQKGVVFHVDDGV